MRGVQAAAHEDKTFPNGSIQSLRHPTAAEWHLILMGTVQEKST